MSRAYNNSLLARNIRVSGIHTSVSGLLISSSGNFTNSLQVNGIDVSVGGHTHTASQITDFASAVSGYSLPTINASLLTSGTLSDSRLSANVVLTNDIRLSDSRTPTSHSHTSSDINNFNSSVSGLVSGIYASLSNPTFTGVPLVPTASSGTNTNQIASTSFVRTEISNLVSSAPSTLDTLNELATALGNDSNFATTITNSLASKASLSGAVFTGSVSSPSGNFTNSLRVNDISVSISGHNHIIGDITGLQTALDNKQASGNYAVSSHTHTAAQITDFNSSVSGVLQLNNIDVSLIRSYTEVSGFPVSGVSSTYYLASDSSKIYQWTGSQYIEIGPSLDTISANNITLGTMLDNRLSSNVVLNAQLNTRLGQASGVVDAMSRVDAAAGVTAGSNQALLAFFTPTATTTISQISMANAAGAVSAGLTLARMGLYTYPTEGGAVTLVARTASDTSLFAIVNTVYTRSLDTTGGYPSTYTLIAGTRYAVGYICVGTTQPQLTGRNILTAVGSLLSPRLSGASNTGQSDLPTSFTPSNNSQAPFARFS